MLNSLRVHTTHGTMQFDSVGRGGPGFVFARYACMVHHEDIDAPVGQRKVRGPLEAAPAGG